MIPLPKSIGPYEIRSELGGGGFGKVYLAFDALASRAIALKKIKTRPQNSDQRAALLKEVQLVSKLDFHPNVVPILAVDFDVDGRLFYTMPVASGGSMRKRVGDCLNDSRTSLRLEDALDCISKVASGLAAAHGQQIAHFDMKPENVLLFEDSYRICDFGLAQEMAMCQELTACSPYYAAPEQFDGRADLRSDVFALGVMLYECLGGRLPHRGENSRQTAHLAKTGQRPALRSLNPSLPSHLTDLVEDCLSASPEQRPANAMEFVRRLPRIADDTTGPDHLARTLVSQKNKGAEFQISACVDGRPKGGPGAARPRFRVGDILRLQLKASADCWITMINISPTGDATILLPNRFNSDPFVKRGIPITFPEPGDKFKFKLSGPPGIETIKIYATTKPVEAQKFLPTEKNEVFRQYSRNSRMRAIEVLEVATEVSYNDASNWAETSLELEVE